MREEGANIFGVMSMGSPDGTGQVVDGASHSTGECNRRTVGTMLTLTFSPGSESATKRASSTSTMARPPNFPPPKTDKPRPHVCTTCMRSFARLEHLKRHERSHTKEKPFECPECTRCFARRDLLLRHQQKLHSTTTPSSRPRSGRRESVAAVANGRVRKNSTASATAMRPRANTLSHVDTATLGMLVNGNGNFGRSPSFLSGPEAGHHHGVSLAPGTAGGYPSFRGMPSEDPASLLGLSKLETHGLSVDLSGGLRTAPASGGYGAELGMNGLAFGRDPSNTINPHALHMHGLGMDPSGSPFHHMFADMSASNAMNGEDGSFDWIAEGFENHIHFGQANETAIMDSSPSAMSTNSPTGTNDMGGGDGALTHVHPMASSASSMWPHTITAQGPMVQSPMGMDLTSNFSEMVAAPIGTVSPKSLLAQGGGSALDMNLPTPPDLSAMNVAPGHAGMQYVGFQLPLSRDGGASTASTASADSSLRQSSITTVSSDLISDHIRCVLIAGLSQNAGFGQRKYSPATVSSALSPESGSRPKRFNVASFPSTHDLQRYVSAYIRYFHPHLPFLHIPSLNFESPEYTSPISLVSAPPQFSQTAVAGGGGCLILSLAAIGALYEHEMGPSKELFECAKRLISNYLEERRKANMAKTQFAPRHHAEREDTPLWLVQAMLLNVIYGHNCGDKTAAELASNHCAALVSLARGAELARPSRTGAASSSPSGSSLALHVPAVPMGGGLPLNGWRSMVPDHRDETDWYEWKVMEERKRTLYAVFILSSMLVTAYNHPPALTNSEIRLDLPCDEELWAAESAPAWRNLGGAAMAESKSITFAGALTHLLMAAQRQQRRKSSAVAQPPVVLPAESELKPSTFGCLILVNALHNYIWETRQRHLGRQWTSNEIEQMHAHIEPALRAWQAAWASNPSHSLERPNPFGAGPLSADCIPLLDLAYVRLFVNLGRSKEALWQRDYDAVAQELAKGPESLQGSDSSSPPQQQQTTSGISPGHRQDPNGGGSDAMPDMPTMENRGPLDLAPSQSSRRERHLRKAAFYAADSLLMSDKLGLSFTEHTSRELPTQSAICAFDCAQVLAEWMTTVQERVGKYLGVIGRDELDLMQVPAVLLLEDEDRKLIQRIDEVLTGVEHKVEAGAILAAAHDGGYGSKILLLTAHLLEREAVWPGKPPDMYHHRHANTGAVVKVMARSLETQAVHIKERALASVTNV